VKDKCEFGPVSPSNVHILHPSSPPLAGYLRVGHTGHHKLEALHAADRLSFSRLVFDAAYVVGQADFLRAQKAAGREIVIDLNVAETAMPGRFGSAAGKLPWGNPDRPWTPGDFGATRNDDFAKRFAQFIATIGPSAVLAPVHVADGDDWRSIDIRATERLRIELDRVGAKDVAIDHLIIIGAREFRDSEKRGAALAGLGDLPVQNLWVRISGFGATSTGARTRHVIEAARSVQDLSLPLVLDMAGGFAGLSALAFGAFGGISHGAGQRESFDLAQWRKLPNGKGGGTSFRVYVPDLDRYLTEEQLRAFFAVRGTKARFACVDSSCCSHHEDMLENGHAHFITQRSRQLDVISKIPPLRRAENFLLRQLDPAVRSTKQASKLKFGDEGVQKLVVDAKSRLTRLRDALGALHETDGVAVPISASPLFRGTRPGSGGMSVIQGGYL
jgi:hypothetical protein